MTIKTIHLHGSLAKFIPQIQLDVDTPVMAVRALIANFGEKFEKAIRQGTFRIVRGGLDGDLIDDIDETEINVGTSKHDIHFIPVVAGSGGIVKVVVGVVLIVAGVYFEQPWMVNMGVSMAIGGVAEMLAGTPKTNDYVKANAPMNPSFVFNGSINTYAQGGPIPLVYGRFRVGSTIISAGMEAAAVSLYTGTIPPPVLDLRHN